jgi:RNA polymerase sigma factor (sigma-70 family)
MCKIQKVIEDYYNDNKSNSSSIVLYNTMKNYASYAIAHSNYGDVVESTSDFNEVLTVALNSYDLTLGIAFKTFFWTCWRNYQGTKIIRKTAKKRISSDKIVSLNQHIKQDDGSQKEMGDLIEDTKLKTQIQDAVRKIDFQTMLQSITDEIDKKILEMFYEGFTNTEIAKEIGFSVPAIGHRLKRMATKPYAKLIYQCLKGE